MQYQAWLLIFAISPKSKNRGFFEGESYMIKPTFYFKINFPTNGELPEGVFLAKLLSKMPPLKISWHRPSVLSSKRH